MRQMLFMKEMLLSVLLSVLLNALLFSSYIDAAEIKHNKTDILSPVQAVNLLALKTDTNISGQFIQKKYFKILNKPFTSNGEFSASEEQFIWRTLAPIKSAMIFRENILYLENSHGELTEQDKAQDIGYLMQQLLSGKFESLSEHFSITTVLGEESKHCLMLLAKSKNFAQIFKQIKLCGQGRIGEITLFDPQTNTTVITLSYREVNEQAKVTNANEHHNH